mmetsp:Transcript_143894/g.447042  ORF Transcript_143894/g.447042 Transcript_143894/m.447042 type:complete len:171 (-) Transcript_143894:90-602(-)|eukprot:CAMPEP_0204576432 /NCGR_PEP_ID=MMETSP0661-20131031/41773_1 /ASSEMBLY_ACC=CAM_ASM_000606 /TAXON_ID=109239 /ORGANISM="Alexandrium margalefi, Strain AMGDE01CS-322" /LENGTH=170 /DNA_ID=CAMNT_0051585181 /DNA_START=65 /DNA_END=577 /DNA_ORIENTATION=+
MAPEAAVMAPEAEVATLVAPGKRPHPDAEDALPLLSIQPKMGQAKAKEKKEKKDKTEKKEKKEHKEKKAKKEGGEAGGEGSHPRSHLRSFKVGQKYSPPPTSDPLRAFYESLLQENEDSAIAVRWCVEHGVLSEQEHKHFLKKYAKAKVLELRAAEEARGRGAAQKTALK